MELTLALQSETTVAVGCDGQPSHSFELPALTPDPAIPGRPPQPGVDPVGYGRALYAALFPPSTPAAQALAAAPARLLLVCDERADAVAWEYAYGPDGFLVLDVALVRGLPVHQRAAAPTLDGGLHLVAVPANPLDASVAPLDIDGEWRRLAEIVGALPAAITLERTRPATLEQLRRLLAGQQGRVLHFMGHGGHDEGGAVLLFEQGDGGLAPVSAKELLRKIRGTAFLVTLNACVSAKPGATEFANLAAALVRQGTPYALGMRLSVTDADARRFSRVFYSELARGSSVETALQQARQELEAHGQPWAVGVPVLYTALAAPAAGFAQVAGVPAIREHQPPLDLLALPRAEGAFQGRHAELRRLGALLTADSRPRLLTIHGAGGQGKTALAREAVERFAHAFPGGVIALSLEVTTSRAQAVAALARFLGVDTERIAASEEIERQVLARLGQQRTLLVLDNAETLAQAALAGAAEARELAQLLREQLPAATTMLATSREYLGWGGEEGLAIGGLDHGAGARLFAQYAPQRRDAIALAEAAALSERLEGHPLSLRLLGSAFNSLALPLADFVRDHADYLFQSEDRYRDAEHRHRSLYQSIDFSVRFLDAELRDLLGGLWVFHAPFLPETAAQIFDPDGSDPEGEQSPVYDQLHQLAQRSLLERETITTREGTTLFYRLHPTVRRFAEQFLPPPVERDELLRRFGSAYAGLAQYLYNELNRDTRGAAIARSCAADMDRAVELLSGAEQGWFQLRWGWVLQRLGDRRRGLVLTETALRAAHADHQLQLQALNNTALVYDATGQPGRALALYEQALPLWREVNDRAGEAATLNNMALVYQATGQPGRALALYEQALPLMREVGDRAGEATTLNNMAAVYDATGQPGRALALFEQALPLRREVGDRAGEAATLNGMAYVLMDMGKFVDALRAFESSVSLEREVRHRAGEAAGLAGTAVLLYNHLNQSAEAVTHVQQALDVLMQTGLPQDAAGHTPERLQQMLEAMRRGEPLNSPSAGPATLPTEHLQTIVSNTIAVLTALPERRAEWRGVIAQRQQQAQQQGPDWQIEVELFSAVLALLDGRGAALPAGHPYAATIDAIREGVAQDGGQP